MVGEQGSAGTYLHSLTVFLKYGDGARGDLGGARKLVAEGEEMSLRMLIPRQPYGVQE